MRDDLPAVSCCDLLCWSRILLCDVAAQAGAGIVWKLDAGELWLHSRLGLETRRLVEGTEG